MSGLGASVVWECLVFGLVGLLVEVVVVVVVGAVVVVEGAFLALAAAALAWAWANVIAGLGFGGIC